MSWPNAGLTGRGLVLPVCAVILERIGDYRAAFESYAQRLLPLIEWEPTDQYNVRVLNESAIFYGFFDATPHAEFLCGCVARTIEQDLPADVFLERYDAFTGQGGALVDMPDWMLDLLFRFVHQNGGRLSRRARNREFKALTENEVARTETLYHKTFGAREAKRR